MAIAQVPACIHLVVYLAHVSICLSVCSDYVDSFELYRKQNKTIKQVLFFLGPLERYK